MFSKIFLHFSLLKLHVFYKSKIAHYIMETIRSFEKHVQAQSNDYCSLIIYIYKKPWLLPARRLHRYHHLHYHYLLHRECSRQIFRFLSFSQLSQSFCHIILFLLLKLEDSNLMMVIISIKTEFVVHFSYFRNGA